MLSLHEFKNELQQVRHETFTTGKSLVAKGVDNFEEIRNHLINYYQPLDATHSFMDSTGQVWDCIPINQQPSLQSSKMSAAQPKDIPGEHLDTPVDAKQLTPYLNQGKTDQEGNVIGCPEGSVPIRRLTMEELTRFESLNDFFLKAPRSMSRHKQLDIIEGAAEAVHKYAHARSTVNNIGGHSFLNIWRPQIVNDQIFSLSQHWYAAGPDQTIQTVEAGWQVFPGKYGSALPCLFVYWTADGYRNTGSYNNDKGAFVVTNNRWLVGGPLQYTSTIDGPQAEFELTWYLSGGNWWLYLNGVTAQNAIGYYPASQYGNGPLAHYATSIDYGGEVVGRTSFPEMGSGRFAGEGYRKAAYHRNIYFYDLQGVKRNAALNFFEPSPESYTIQGGLVQNWDSYFFYGGPGAANV